MPIEFVSQAIELLSDAVARMKKGGPMIVGGGGSGGGGSGGMDGSSSASSASGGGGGGGVPAGFVFDPATMMVCLVLSVSCTLGAIK